MNLTGKISTLFTSPFFSFPKLIPTPSSHHHGGRVDQEDFHQRRLGGGATGKTECWNCDAFLTIDIFSGEHQSWPKDARCDPEGCDGQGEPNRTTTGTAEPETVSNRGCSKLTSLILIYSSSLSPTYRQLESTPIDRKKKTQTTLVNQHSQTIESGPSQASSVSEQDLTSVEGPSEKYWETLAESRRRALEDSLRENEGLHGRVRSLEEELNVTNEMLDEARSLVEILKEMLEENEGGQEDKEEEEHHTPPPSSAEKEESESDSQDD